MNHKYSIPEYPSKELVNKYISDYRANDNYSNGDNAIKLLIKSYPKNENIESVILKVNVINSIYGTHIVNTYAVAKNIYNHGNEIDELIKEGNLDAVNKISVGHGVKSNKHNTEIVYYSFATKYCFWHNGNKFPIYDSHVNNLILAYKEYENQNGLKNFSNFKTVDLKSYKEFVRIINDFRETYDLKEYETKEIDMFLWSYGKDIQEKANQIIIK